MLSFKFGQYLVVLKRQAIGEENEVVHIALAPLGMQIMREQWEILVIGDKYHADCSIPNSQMTYCI